MKGILGVQIVAQVCLRSPGLHTYMLSPRAWEPLPLVWGSLETKTFLLFARSLDLDHKPYTLNPKPYIILRITPFKEFRV